MKSCDTCKYADTDVVYEPCLLCLLCVQNSHWTKIWEKEDKPKQVKIAEANIAMTLREARAALDHLETAITELEKISEE